MLESAVLGFVGCRHTQVPEWINQEQLQEQLVEHPFDCRKSETQRSITLAHLHPHSSLLSRFHILGHLVCAVSVLA